MISDRRRKEGDKEKLKCKKVIGRKKEKETEKLRKKINSIERKKKKMRERIEIKFELS